MPPPRSNTAISSASDQPTQGGDQPPLTLQPWLREKLSLISQKTKLAEAIRYALSRWARLALFLDDGRIEIDNNVVQRAIRPLALNRKNALSPALTAAPSTGRSSPR